MPELFVLDSAAFRLTWSGAASEEAPPPEAVFRAEALGRPLRVRLADGALHPVEDVWTAPFELAEEASYSLVLRSHTDAPVALRHRDPSVTGRLTRAEHGRVLHGPIRFGAQVGESTFEVLVGGELVARFQVPVAPRKVTRADVAAMQAEIEAVLSGLAFDYLRATTTQHRSEPAGAVARPVWLTHLREALPALESALASVTRRPRTTLARPEGIVRAAWLTRPDAQVRRAVAQGRGQGPASVIPRLGLSVRARLPAHPARASLDTPAHRWLRARLSAVTQRLAGIRSEEARRSPGARRAAVLTELAQMEHRLRRLLVLPPLAEAASGPIPEAVPLVLRTVGGYAEARAALQGLGVGLALERGEALATPRDLAGLYELWCYLVLARALSTILGQPLPADSFFAATIRGVSLRLQRGRAHALRFARNDQTVRLAYEPRFPASPGLLAQRPDFLLTVERGGAGPRRIVLDAKYRRDDSAAYRRRHGAPGPPEEALGDLHRYRDAIVVEGAGGAERAVEQAVALFPYRAIPSGAFEHSRLWTSLGRIGVGAIPLLPGATCELTRWLKTVLKS